MSVSEYTRFRSQHAAEVLLSKAQGGCNVSLGELLQTYRDYLTVIADEELTSDLKVKASASDLIQDSFLEAKRDFRQFTGATPLEFQRWLRRLLLNNIANVLRCYCGTEKRDLSREIPISQCGINGTNAVLEADDPAASSIAMKNELLEAVQAALLSLPEHYQAVIRWRNLERVSFAEIGRRFGRSPEAAQQLWVRALNLLQQELDSVNDSKRHRSDSNSP